VDEVIPHAAGSSACRTAQPNARLGDAVLMAIVDSFDIEGRSTRFA
jgi:hypothetical protein